LPEQAVKPWVDALYAANADVIVQASNHDYQRFAKQDPARNPDPARGLRAFVVGTGGIGLYAFTGAAPNVEASDDKTYGALEMALRPGGYDFQFIRAAGGTFTDSGSGTCH
jgi:acid phosphatase type 7